MPHMRRLFFLIPIFLILGLFYFFSKGLHQDPRELPSTLIQQPAPAFALHELDRQKLQSEKIFLGRLTLLNVWASWCESCQEEQAFLMSVKKAHPELFLAGLNYKDKPNQARAWLTKFGNPYQIILEDTDGKVGINYGVYGTPETFLINAKGIILAKHVGPLDQTGIQALLSQVKS
ncbi:MAG: thiol:disulfide interchange protein [Gammaproteobacteria bacterium]|jgi:cytochrome c biogenesis protein CcmG/thiol:disulfide interchange protein DsbE|nr:thiol:disulfide interchange protein [Gammaproteobacteria bacterium]